MNTLYYNVIDCEHEGDVRIAENDLAEIGDYTLLSEDYEHDDEGEICGCTIVISVDSDDFGKFVEFGCYKY